MSEDVRNNLPSSLKDSTGVWFETWTGTPAQRKLSGDGATVFWGLNMRKESDNSLWYMVWSIGLDLVWRERFRLGPNAGQGDLDTDQGWLIATVYLQAGQARAARSFVVPGFVRVT